MNGMGREPLLSLRLESALRRAASWHAAEVRKGSQVPYFAHPVAVAMILDRLGFDEDVVIAGLLHDVVEDTDATPEDVLREFGPRVSRLVADLSERKVDDLGAKRPWIDRKTEHIDHLAGASVESRAIALADKLHNLTSIEFDLAEGRPVWSLFNASRESVLWYYRTSIERYSFETPELAELAGACRAVLDRVTRDTAAPAGKIVSEGVPAR